MKIAVIGTGNMGFWIAKELAKENKVAVFDLDKEKAEGVENVRVLSELSELKEFEPELLVNAVSLSNTIEVFKEVVGHISTECIIGDVTSVKGNLSEYYKESGFRFYSIHPMFGPTFANVQNLKEENVVIIKESCEDGKEFFNRFFEGLEVNIFEYSFEEHDEMMAYSLTLPFVSSITFARCVKPGVVPGTTFAKHKKLAQGLLSEDDSLLSEVLFNTKSVEQLDKITSQLEFLKHIIKAKEYDEIKEVLEKLRGNVNG